MPVEAGSQRELGITSAARGAIRAKSPAMTLPTSSGPASQPQASAPIPAFANPGSGRGKAAAEAITADPRFVLRDVGHGELAAALRAEAKRGTRRVLVAGGDGTVATAAAVACETKLELAVLAAGTLNHFARDLRVPLEFEEALELAASGSTSPVDLGFVNDRPFLNTSSVGAYVGFVRHRDYLERWMGYRLASFISGVRMLGRLRSFHVRVKVEDEERDYRTAMVFSGVGERETRFPTFGGRVEGGRPGLHVIAVHGKAPARLTALGIAAAAKGIARVSRRPDVDAFLVEDAVIEMPKRVAWLAVDGEIIRLEAPLRYRLERGALAVVTPPLDEDDASR
jgi:diacylglycerol kinase family enzyme